MGTGTRKRARRTLPVALYALACFSIDVVPRSGPPAFRYTGSDPAERVWNLGWPLTLAILDPRDGLHVGPSAFLVLPAQVLILATAIASAWVISRAQGRPDARHPACDGSAPGPAPTPGHRTLTQARAGRQIGPDTTPPDRYNTPP